MTQFFELLVEGLQVDFPLGQVCKQNVGVEGILFGERRWALVEVLRYRLHTLFNDRVGLEADLFQVETLQVSVLAPCNQYLVVQAWLNRGSTHFCKVFNNGWFKKLNPFILGAQRAILVKIFEVFLWLLFEELPCPHSKLLFKISDDFFVSYVKAFAFLFGRDALI